MRLDIRNEKFNLSDFTGFWFGDLSVGMGDGFDWKGFIVNSDGFSMTGGPEFEDEFADMPFGNRRFLMGTTELNKEFNFEVVLVEIGKGDLKRFLREIRARKVDILRFDFNRNYGYDVKLGELAELEYDPIRKCDETDEILFNVRVGLGFITVGDWKAKWVNGPDWLKIASNGSSNINSGNFIDNDLGEKYISLSGNTITINNYHTVDNFIEIESSTGFELNMDGELYESGTPGEGLLRVNFEYGIERDNNGFVGSNGNYRLWVVPAESSISFTIRQKRWRV